MTPEAFKATETEPTNLSVPLRALWHTAKDSWDTAHAIIQPDESVDAAWVHAHLHRIEGDLRNAAYWYNRAGKPVCEDDISAEWDVLFEAFNP